MRPIGVEIKPSAHAHPHRAGTTPSTTKTPGVDLHECQCVPRPLSSPLTSCTHTILRTASISSPASPPARFLNHGSAPRVSAQHQNPLLISFPSLPGTLRDRHTSGPCYIPEFYASNCPQRVSSPLTKEPPCRAPAASCDHGPVFAASLSISLSTPPPCSS